MTEVDPARRTLLARFGKAFNSNDVATAAGCVTDDFTWLYYEGPDHPHARVIRGIDAACAAVVERVNRLKGPIVFSESNEYPCDDKVFVTYRASGEFRDTGPFDVRAIDIYTFRGDKLSSKDTYWKIITS